MAMAGPHSRFLELIPFAAAYTSACGMCSASVNFSKIELPLVKLQSRMVGQECCLRFPSNILKHTSCALVSRHELMQTGCKVAQYDELAILTYLDDKLHGQFFVK